MNTCDNAVVVSETECNVVTVTTQGPQGIQGVPGSATFTTPLTVAALPTSTAGTRSMVTDATTTNFGAIVSGGGTNTVPVYADGVAWRVG